MNIPLINNDVIPKREKPAVQLSSQRGDQIDRSISEKSKNYSASREYPPRSPNQKSNLTSLQQINPPEPDSFRVFVRYRPLSEKEKNAANPKKRLHIVKKEDQMVFVLEPDIGNDFSYKKEKSYVFDEVFDDLDDTTSVYTRSISPAIENAISGYNSTVFAYGMTGAGKTYTMFGDLTEVTQGRHEHGIISMVVNDLFASFVSEKNSNFNFTLKFSYIEIYNEHTRDLLSSSGENLMIVEDPVRGVMIPSLQEYTITSLQEIVDLIRQGNGRRVMASTKANEFSSRSHAIIQLVIEKRDKAKDVIDAFTQSKFCLVDLAGSERAATTENRGIRMIEGANINRSLLALGNCINLLSDPEKKGAFVPYRDSKLTRLLKDSLGGNTRTIMIACISPSYLHYDETINTLKYANRARNIKRNITKNVKEVELHVSQYREIIDSLRSEIDSLRRQLNDRNAGSANYANSSIISEEAKEINSNIEDLGGRLFRVLEENWEIKQTLAELEELKVKNEQELATKQAILDGKIVPKEPISKEKLFEDLMKLKENMANNERILKEMQESMNKNIEEKKKIQEKINFLTSQAHSARTDVPEGDLHTLCRVLNMEKIDLQNQNKEIKNEARNLAREKNQKESEIKNLQREMENMKKQLQEKDRLLQQNQAIINNMRNKKEYETKRSFLSSPGKQNFRSQTKEAHPTPGVLSRKDVSPSAKREFRSPGPSNKYPTTTTAASKYPKESPPNQSLAQAVAKTPKSTNDQTKKIVQQQAQSNQQTQRPQTQQSPQQVVPVENNQATKKQEVPKPLAVALERPRAEIISNHIVRNRHKQQQQPVVSLDELKIYAERIKNMNFDNVPVKAKRKKHSKKKATEGANFLKELGIEQKLNPILPSENKGSEQQQQQAGFIGKSELNELSSIINENIGESPDTSVKDLILDNVIPQGKSDVRYQSPDVSKQKDLAKVSHSGSQQQSLYSKLDVEKNQQSSKYSEGLDLRSFENIKAKINPLNNAGTSLKDVAPRTERTQQADNRYFDATQRSPYSNSILNSPDKKLAVPENQARQEPAVYSSMNDDLFKQYKQAPEDPKSMKSSTGSNKHSPMQSRQQNWNESGATISNDQNVRPSTAFDFDDSRKNNVHDIRSLDMARDVIRTFKIKLYSLSYAVDNNLIDDYYTEEIINLLKEHNEQKYTLASGDVTVLKKLENAVISRLNQKYGNTNSSTNLSNDTSGRSANTYGKRADRYEGNFFLDPKALENSDQGEKLKPLQQVQMNSNVIRPQGPSENLTRDRSQEKLSSYDAGSKLSEIYDAPKSRPNPAVQNLIDKQKKNLQGEIEKLQKQNAIRQQYGGGNMEML